MWALQQLINGTEKEIVISAMGFVEKKYLPHYTYDDWLHWEGRWELIEGIPIAMSPMPLPAHQRAAAELRAEFTFALRKKECKSCRAYDPLDFKISDTTILQPDILLVCGEIRRSFLDFPPILVVEILSTATEERDRNIKYEYYEQEGVRYYLIVDTKLRNIEIYQLVDGKYQLQPYNDRFEFVITNTCSINPPLNNIWD